MGYLSFLVSDGWYNMHLDDLVLIVLVDLVCGGYSSDWWVCALWVVLGFDLWVPRV